MSLSFYGLARSPFESDPSTFFEAAGHADAFWSLIYGITENRGFIAIGGAPGIGKTATLDAAIRSLDLTHPSLLWIHFSDPWLSAEVVLATVADRLNMAMALTADGDLGPVRNRLVRLKDNGKTVILVIDKAENLDVRTLKLLNQLASFGGEEGPLFQTIFLCEPSVDALLTRPEAAAIDRRVTVRIDIPALSAGIARSYVAFRLNAAGAIPASVMTASAIRALVRYAGGNPSRIHHLGNRALSYGFARNQRPITAGNVKAAISTAGSRRATASGGTMRTLLTASIIAVTAVVAGLVLLTIHRYRPVPLSPPMPVAAPIMRRANPVAAATARPLLTFSAPPAHAIAPKPAASTPAKSATVTPAAVKPAAVTVAIKVKPGDTILSILRRASLPTTDAELHKIHILNASLSDSNLIFPGQTIIVPAQTSKAAR